jgi:putative tryptophan/tyrosine transport system substrate-binding protein
MKIHQLLVLLALVHTSGCAETAAEAPSKVYRVGVLSTLSASVERSPYGPGIVRGLRELAYAPGNNLVFESRGAEMHYERLPRLAGELLASKVDVIVTFGYPAALAAKRATNTVPIVAMGAGDAVETGLVASLARPGGNLTGISETVTALSVKRLDLLKEAVPNLRRVAMLWNAADPAMTLRYQGAAAVAQSLGVQVQPLGVREPEDFDEAFASMTRYPPDAILMVSDTLTALNRQRVFEYAAIHKLPAIYEYGRYAHDGGLMSFGPDQSEIAERAAQLILRVLKGAKPADLPLEQPTRFRFIVNLKTAKALGLTIPQSILARADEVIE